MFGIEYPTQKKQGVKRIDRWNISNMDDRFDPYVVRDACGINSNFYIGSDVIYGANSRSLLRQFDARTVAKRFPDAFLSEYVS
ncbi:hypothetical protein TVAG_190150 [Trichomonas vaginalis G3]|uniref:Uncharacterized protein n=1 Tax=Trichomonas vaginalis (strain ATCC PRA-98 / G3) TaxID=412133 RepID=A2DKE4_TRIV3|nr:hypothetical protein TVAGG3_0996400 [Trichomonas vaginalis G3]EAY19121.1 hypothetical protein TVAG_190150 [Trichomonas vaginalis G3]KAI5490419.1 hypothetical protein TVAGG3_0996400 [Trichomonas vaginalis G3]|eukprot:XP_001580107.1 hypothetical protein [Trichomonas vaginalis G3]